MYAELGEAGRQTNCRDIFFAFFQNRTTHSKELITPEKDKHKLMTGWQESLDTHC